MAESSSIKRIPKFFQEVKYEGSKVTWPSRRETLLTTTIVFIFALIASLYFLAVDHIILKLLNMITG
jgi:preprotein translocase subunit SecE